ncbi:hypothetical protein IWW39_003792 [Coemansia spiralis]|uniref:Uncharacterized protein n=1 Tax=Coemansia spiralis TaxID=417178 RepID=A0A9W8L494_9FUNG|nr:hypothetical protein IWW39_003792 [Coemansia spiralis]
MPQVHTNWRAKSTAGLSFSLVILWLAGDGMGLFGCLVLQQQPFQVFLAVYFFLFDVVLLLQWYCYRLSTSMDLATCLPNNSVEGGPLSGVAAQETGEIERLINPDNPRTQNDDYAPTPPSTQNVTIAQVSPPTSYDTKTFWQRTPVRAACAISILLVLLWPVLRKRLLQLEVDLELLGVCISWASNITFHLSRLPQLWHNYKRQSVEGLSLGMFAIIFIANAAYALSLLALIPVSGPNFFHLSAAYIYGPIGSMIIDMFMFFQFYALNRRKKPYSTAVAMPALV